MVLVQPFRSRKFDQYIPALAINLFLRLLGNSSDEYEIVIDNEIFFIKQTGNTLEMTNQVGQVVKTGEAANCNNYITWSDGDIWRRNMNECAQSWWHQCNEHGMWGDEYESCVDTDPRTGSESIENYSNSLLAIGASY